MGQRASVIVGLVLLALIAWLAYITLPALWSGLASLPTEIFAPLVVAAGTVLVSVITVVGGRYLERRSQIETEQRPRKVQIYEGFLDEWFGFLELEKVPSKRLHNLAARGDELAEFVARYTKELILWGSPEVVRTYKEFRTHTTGLGEGAREPSRASGLTRTLVLFEDMLRAIRTDVGLSNRGLAEGDILRLFVTDDKGGGSSAAPTANPALNRQQRRRR